MKSMLRCTRVGRHMTWIITKSVIYTLSIFPQKLSFTLFYDRFYVANKIHIVAVKDKVQTLEHHVQAVHVTCITFRTKCRTLATDADEMHEQKIRKVLDFDLEIEN